MNDPKRIRRVTVKTERTFIFRVQNEMRVGWCSECDAEVRFKNVAGAAQEFGVNELAIYRLIETRAVHYNKDDDGQVLVCLRSFV